jgi:hypothetical protein
MSPVRYASRDGSAPRSVSQACPGCGAALPSTRARYCSAACKQRAYRLRHRDPAPPSPNPTSRPNRAQTIYVCPDCDTRYLGQQRCPDCQRFCRRLGPGGACPHCDEPVLLAELLGEEVLL